MERVDGLIESGTPRNGEPIWLDHLSDEGFWIAKGLIPTRLLAEIAENCDDYYRRDHQRFGVDFLTELNEIEHLRNAPEYDYIFVRLLMESVKLDEMMVEALHRNVIIHNYNLIRLMPGSRSKMLGHEWHRDVFFFGPQIRTAVNVLIPLQDTTCKNGATEILLGTHKHKDLPDDKLLPSLIIQPELSVGDALILDASTFHKAGDNSTSTPRTIISLKYTLSFFTQQYDFCRCLPVEEYPGSVRDRLGYQVRVPENLEQFRVPRELRRYKWSIRE